MRLPGTSGSPLLDRVPLGRSAPGGAPSARCRARSAGGTRRPWRRSTSPRAPPDRREQAHPADAHGQLVVLCLEAEGPGHAAAAGVELDDLGARESAAAARRSTAVPASAFWWQWPWNRMPLRAGSLAQRQSSAPRAAAPRRAACAPRRRGRRAAARAPRAASAGTTARQPVIGRGRPPAARVSASALARASSSRPLEIARAPAAARRSRAARRSPPPSSSSIAARPTPGSVNVVNESARKITGPRPALARAACGPSGSASRARSAAAGALSIAMPSRPTRRRAGSTAARSRSRAGSASGSTPNSRERSGVPWIALWCDEELGLQRRHVDATAGTRSCTPCTRGRGRGSRAGARRRAPRAGSGSLSAFTSAFARPRVACSSSRVAM